MQESEKYRRIFFDLVEDLFREYELEAPEISHVIDVDPLILEIGQGEVSIVIRHSTTISPALLIAEYRLGQIPIDQTEEVITELMFENLLRARHYQPAYGLDSDDCVTLQFPVALESVTAAELIEIEKDVIEQKTSWKHRYLRSTSLDATWDDNAEFDERPVYQASFAESLHAKESSEGYKKFRSRYVAMVEAIAIALDRPISEAAIDNEELVMSMIVNDIDFRITHCNTIRPDLMILECIFGTSAVEKTASLKQLLVMNQKFPTSARLAFGVDEETGDVVLTRSYGVSEHAAAELLGTSLRMADQASEWKGTGYLDEATNEKFESRSLYDSLV